MRLCRIISFLLLPCLFLTACRSREQEREALLEIICLDVGQGTSVLLRTREGDVLVDAGSENSQSALCSRLKELGVSQLRCLILTHFDVDHIGGADAVLREFSVDAVWVGESASETEAISRFLDAAKACALSPLRVYAGAQLILDEAVITVLAPSLNDDAKNEDGVILTVRCGACSFLMMGDADARAERALVETYGEAQLRADLLLVSHHGSNDGSDLTFLNAVKPSAAIISCGAGNPYGHPDGRTIAKLLEVGAEIYRTDLMGDIRFCIDDEGYRLCECVS